MRCSVVGSPSGVKDSMYVVIGAPPSFSGIPQETATDVGEQYINPHPLGADGVGILFISRH